MARLCKARGTFHHGRGMGGRRPKHSCMCTEIFLCYQKEIGGGGGIVVQGMGVGVQCYSAPFV